MALSNYDIDQEALVIMRQRTNLGIPLRSQRILRSPTDSQSADKQQGSLPGRSGEQDYKQGRPGLQKGAVEPVAGCLTTVIFVLCKQSKLQDNTSDKRVATSVEGLAIWQVCPARHHKHHTGLLPS